MNELRKYATFSVDMIGEPVRINRMFSLGRARIFYLGPNPNRSIIEGEAAYKLASSIPGTPIIGLYNYETDDFEGHGEGQSAYGFVPLYPNLDWVKVEENGKEREYLEVDVVIWDGRFEEAKNILTDNKSLSMELNPATMKGTMVNLGDKMYYKITEAEFAGITVLGEEVEPCFKDAGFLAAYSSMVNEYAKYMKDIQENEEGGMTQMENIEEVKVEETVETEIKENEEVESETIADTEVVEEETKEESEEAAEEVKEEATEEATESEVEPTEDAAVEESEETTEDVASEDTPAEEIKAEEETEAKDEEVGEENADGDGKDDKYSILETELADLKAKNESLTQELNAAQEALKTYTRKEKLEIINKFSTKLESEDELIAKLTDKVDELTKEEIKAELGSALVEQIDKEQEEQVEEANDNFSLNINLEKDYTATAWDLVKRYKNGK